MSPDERSREARGVGPSREYAQYAGAGLQFAITFLVFGFVGWWLDGRLGTEPWLMVIGIALGATGAFISLVKRIPPVTGGRRTKPPTSNS